MRYYFTNENGDCPINDHIGNIRGARKAAEAYSNQTGETIYINSTDPDEIVDVIFGEE